MARERGQREAQARGARRPRRLPFCRQAKASYVRPGVRAPRPPRGRQARPRLPPKPRPGPAWPRWARGWVRPQPPRRAPHRPTPRRRDAPACPSGSFSLLHVLRAQRRDADSAARHSQRRGPRGDAGGAGGAAATEGPPADPPGGVPASATSARLRSPSPEESDVPT